MLPESLTQNTQNTMHSFAQLKWKHLKHCFISVSFFPKCYYSAWPMCLVSLHWDEAHNDLTMYKIVIFQNI